MATKRVLSIGQCWADHTAIASVLTRSFGAEVIGADSAEDALERAEGEPYVLVLVNRVLDAGGSGVQAMGLLRADDRFAKTPIMLVSNQEEAQREAMAAGAVRGFGKAALGRADMLARLRPYFEE